MELVLAIVVGVLFAAGTYLMMARHLLRVVLGTALLGHGTNLLLLGSGRLKRGAAPILGDHAAAGAGTWASRYTDPLPPALILTAIVIGLATTALLFVLAYRTHHERGSADLALLRARDEAPDD